jgi:hypothetical protein
MTAINSTQYLDLLGKTVYLADHIRDPKLTVDMIHKGQVIAVVVPLPGSIASGSILVEYGPGRADYFDLVDITLISVT